MDLTKNKNIEVIGINYKDTKINAKNFLNEFGYKINTKLQIILDDFVEAGFISFETVEHND